MGFTLMLLMFAAITVGGLGNPFGALLGRLIIGIFVELWTWIVPNANDLKTVGALAVLILVLLVRPQGLLGTKERIG
jgi:branched-chain amino acid transport system permease protein